MLFRSLIIVLLVLLLLVTILGINLITVSANILETFYIIFSNLFSNILSVLGFTTGLALNETTEIVKKTSKLGIDIVGDSVQDVGKIMINASVAKQNSLDKALQPKNKEGFTGVFDNSDSTIQKRN